MTGTPTFIGRYQVLERLGEGGMGTLFLSRDPAIERLVAIKLLRRGFDSDDARQRFAREARAAGRLHHPHVVTIFDVGEHDGNPFIAMEFLAGETLAQLIRQRARLSLPRKLTLIEELCDGLAYAHRAGLVHRDIKPANVMVDAHGVLKILDFGIVRTEESGMTNAGEIVGTINYMSPEQITGDALDHRSDIFAVGVVAYELLSYTQAFPGTLKDGLLDRIARANASPLQQVVPGLAPEAIRIVEKAMAPDPTARYQDLARMRNDVAALRQRLEREAEQADTSMVGETAVLVLPARPVPATPGAPPDAPTVTLAPLPAELAEAQQALSTGRYQQALLLASRSAAIEPENAEATAIIERAKTGLLEAGRAKASVVPPGTLPAVAADVAVQVGSPSGSSPPSAPVAFEAPAVSAAAPSGTLPSPLRSPVAAPRPYGMTAAVVAGLVVLSTAAFWLTNRSAPSSAPAVAAVQSVGAAEDGQLAGPTGSTGSGDAPSVAPAPGGADLLPSAPVAAGDVAPSSPSSTAPPTPDVDERRNRAIETVRQQARRELARGATAPAAAVIASGLSRYPGDRELERLLADAVARSRDRASASQAAAQAGGAAEHATVTYADALVRARAAAMAQAAGQAAEAVREYLAAADLFDRSTSEADARLAARVTAPTSREMSTRPADAASVLVPVVPPATNPSASTPPSTTSAPVVSPPRAVSPVPPESVTPIAGASPNSPRESSPRAEEAAIRQVLRAYEEAWRTLDVAALERVQALSGVERTRVQQSMDAAREYEVSVTVEQVAMADDGRHATVTAQIAREFTPKVGRTTRHTGRSRLRLEKREGGWVIVAVQ